MYTEWDVSVIYLRIMNISNKSFLTKSECSYFWVMIPWVDQHATNSKMKITLFCWSWSEICLCCPRTVWPTKSFNVIFEFSDNLLQDVILRKNDHFMIAYIYALKSFLSFRFGIVQLPLKGRLFILWTRGSNVSLSRFRIKIWSISGLHLILFWSNWSFSIRD